MTRAEGGSQKPARPMDRIEQAAVLECFRELHGRIGL
jgi:hypothetical protein